MSQPKVRIAIWNGKIAADVPFNWGPIAKQIPGCKAEWDRTVDPPRWKWWSFPLTMASCRALREKFQDALVMTKELEDWAWERRHEEEEMERLRAGESQDLMYVRTESPRLWAAIQTRPFQIAGAAFIARGRRVCLGDEPRLGKTYQALAALNEYGAERVLIGCPKVACNTVWGRKIWELLGERAFVAQGDRARRDEIIRQFNKASGPRFLVINNEMMRVARMYQCPDGHESKYRPGKSKGCRQNHRHKTVYYPEFPSLFDTPWDAAVIDECHNVLASSKHQISDNISQIRLGAVRLPFDDEAMKLAMSGTPWRSRLDLAWGILNWLDPKQFGSYWRFAEQYFGTTPGYGMSSIVNTTLKSETAWQEMLRRYYLCRTKAQVRPQLKPIEYAGTPPPGNPGGQVGVYVDMDGSQLKAYQGIEQMGMAKLRDGRYVIANGHLAELTRMRQFACAQGTLNDRGEFVPSRPSNKLEWVLQFLEERRDLDGKVVIASQFTKLVKMFVKEIRRNTGWEVVSITGETSQAQRDAAQDAFLTGTPRVCIINMFAGGEAIDLSSADEMIFLDEPWRDHVIRQAENRIQNLAKRQQLTVYRLRSVGTMDETIANLTSEQRKRLLAGEVEVLPQYKITGKAKG